MGLRRPRDLDLYTSRDETVAWVRGLAAKLKQAPRGMMFRINVRIRQWNTEWDKPKKQGQQGSKR